MVAAGAQVEKAESCVESVYSCALGQLKQYLPTLDTQFCDPNYKRNLEDGGWSAYYGPRVWDSQAAGTLMGLFFPATSAAAAAKLVCCALVCILLAVALVAWALTSGRIGAVQASLGPETDLHTALAALLNNSADVPQNSELKKQVRGLERALSTAVADAQSQARPAAPGAQAYVQYVAIKTTCLAASCVWYCLLCTGCKSYNCMFADRAWSGRLCPCG